MTMQFEKKLKDFNFWGGAVGHARKLTADELDRLDDMIDQLDGEPWTVTEVNDAFWFDFENLCDWLDLSYEEVMARE